MRIAGTIVFFLLLIFAGMGLQYLWAGSPHAKSSKLQQRGKYLVDNVGQCGDCHTPMNDQGQFVQEKYLQGAELPFKPIGAIPNWADKSANIAGLPGWTEQDAVKFFMTGLGPNGLPARPPMPQYRYSREDAKAVTVYLRSLKPAGK